MQTSQGLMTGPEQRDAASVPKEDTLDRSFARGKRFIVVEDDELVALAMSCLLQNMGGQVHLFHSAEDALRHDNLETVDYFISDYMLGGALNGVEFLNLVARDLARPIQAVLITGDTSSALLRKTSDCPWPILHKPVNMTKLITGLRPNGA